MRDKKRIKPIMKELTEIWELVPDWRFGQLINNMLGDIVAEEEIFDIFFPEDDRWLEYLKKYKEKLTPKKKLVDKDN